MRAVALGSALGLLATAPALGQQTVDYQYDRLGRLTQMADGLIVVTYAYDAGGNLLSRTVEPDSDGDRLADGADNCPAWPNPNQADANGNGIGDACECGDQTGDGFVDIADILEISAAIFEPSLATPLCDTNDDDQCDVADILGVNAKIFGADAFCERSPACSACEEFEAGMCVDICPTCTFCIGGTCAPIPGCGGGPYY